MPDKQITEWFSEIESKPRVKPANSERGKVRLKEINRLQTLLRPVDVEELVPEDHEVRAIWEFVTQLDLHCFYEDIRAVEGVAGREATDPRLMVSLWVYAYKQGISSAREISRLCEYDPAFLWLTGCQSINYHTLADFRVDHKTGLDELFKNILGLLSLEGLITLERVMHDGTKVKANASDKSFRREARLREHLKQAEEQVAAMGDPMTSAETAPRVRAARQRAAREREEHLKKALEELEKVRQRKETKAQEAQARASETDPEARVMKDGHGGYAPSYNVQVSTDAKAGAIVGIEPIQSPADYGELGTAMDQLEQNCDQKAGQVVADGGYTDRETIVEMSERGIDFVGSIKSNDVYVAAGLRGCGIDEAFGPAAFRFEQDANHMVCPSGKTLSYEGQTSGKGQTEFRYRAKLTDCRACPFQSKCCPRGSRNGRMVIRRIEADAVVAFREKMGTDEAKKIYRQRAPVAEFSNLWLKEKIGLRQFRVRGKIKVRMEGMWAAMTRNIQIWIAQKWRPRWVLAGVTT